MTQEHNNISFFQLPSLTPTNNKLGDKEIEAVCADLARFIMHEVCHPAGAYFDHGGTLSLPKHNNLAKWTNK